MALSLNAILLIILIILIIIAVFVVFILKLKLKLNLKEQFADADADANAGTTDLRQCNVYYMDANLRKQCDDGLYDKSVNELEALKGKSSYNTDTLTNVINDKKRIGINTKCKLEMTGWKELDTMQGSDVPYKNIQSSDLLSGNPSEWAFCYKDISKNTDDYISTIGNRQSIVVYPEPVSMTNVSNDPNTNKLARITFKTFDQANLLKDVYCSADLVSETAPSGLANNNTTHLLVINTITNTSTNTKSVNSFQLYTYDVNTNRMLLLRDDSVSSGIYNGIFEYVVDGSSFVYRPKKISATVYKFIIDECPNGIRPSKLVQTAVMDFNVGDFGVKSIPLITSITPTDDLYGDINTLVQRTQDLQGMIDGLKAKIADNNAKSAASGGILSYTPGLLRKKYNIRYSQWSGNTPSFNSKDQMDLLFKTSTLVGTDFTVNPHFSKGTEDYFGFVLEGYVYISVDGDYQFKINSDDPADFYMDGKPAATYYGWHGASDQGISYTLTLTAGYHPIKIRMAEWEGWEALLVYWIPPRTNQGWQLIPTNVFYHDNTQENQTIQVINDNLQKQIDSITLRIKTINDFLTLSKNKATTESVNAINAITNVIVPSVYVPYISSDNRIYLFIGESTTGVNWNDIQKSTVSSTILQKTIVDATDYRILPLPNVDRTTIPVFTIMFWINILSISPNWWRNIFIYGKDDYDRGPAVYIWPGNTKLHIRMRSTVHTNTGANTTDLPLGQWTHIALVFNRTTLTVYINGVQTTLWDSDGPNKSYNRVSDYLELASGNNWLWSNTNIIQFNSYVKQYQGGNKYNNVLFNNTAGLIWYTDPIYVQNMVWYNKALSPTDVLYYYNTDTLDTITLNMPATNPIANTLGAYNMGPWSATNFADQTAQWVWNEPGAASSALANVSIIFEHKYTNTGKTNIAATLHIIIDDIGVVKLNGTTLTSLVDGWGGRTYSKIALTLVPGSNTIQMVCLNTGGPAGLIYSIISSDGVVLGNSGISTTWRFLDIPPIDISLRSVGWGDNCSSAHYGSGGITINGVKYGVGRGTNAFVIKGYTSADPSTVNSVSTASGDTHAGGSSVTTVDNFLNLQGDQAGARVLIVVFHDEGTNAMPTSIRNKLIKFGSNAIRSAGYRSPYIFVKDLYKNKVLYDAYDTGNACKAITFSAKV